MRKFDLQDWRDRRENDKAERKERRLMRTSTFDALMESVGPVVDGDSQIVHEDVLADTIAVEKRRNIERASWIVGMFMMLGFGWVAGWYMQPQYAPEPVTCDVVVHGSGKEASVVRCEGVIEE